VITLAALVAALTLTPGQASLRPLDLPMPPLNPMTAEAPPQLNAASWGLYSVEREAEILAENGDVRRPMASVTKVMTAILVVQNAQPDERVTISANADRTPIGYTGQPEVKQGEVWTVEDLLANLMVQSGNDAAAALAEHVGGSVEGFVAMMNQEASRIGMASTSFANPHGLDADQHYSTARDLMRLGRAAVDYERVMRAASIKSVTFSPGRRGDITVTNGNRLLGVYPGVLGIKTGDTARADRVLISYQQRGARGTVGVVMGTQNHYAATARLLAYAATTLGPRDHLAAAVLGTPVESVLPPWLVPRLQAVRALPTGSESRSAPGSTVGTDRLVRSFRDLLPPLLGGDP